MSRSSRALLNSKLQKLYHDGVLGMDEATALLVGLDVAHEKWDESYTVRFGTWMQPFFEYRNRYQVTVWHGEGNSIFVVTDTEASEKEQPKVIFTSYIRERADDEAARWNATLLPGRPDCIAKPRGPFFVSGTRDGNYLVMDASREGCAGQFVVGKHATLENAERECQDRNDRMNRKEQS